MLDAALSSVTAAVVGVILNLALIFGFSALFGAVRTARIAGVTFPYPAMTSVDLFAVLLAAVGFVVLWRFRWNVLWIVGGSAVAGLVYRIM